MGFGKDRAERLNQQDAEAHSKREWDRQTAPIYEAKAKSLWQSLDEQIETEITEFNAAISNVKRQLRLERTDETLITAKKLTFPQRSVSLRCDLPAHRITFSAVTTEEGKRPFTSQDFFTIEMKENHDVGLRFSGEDIDVDEAAQKVLRDLME